jgi:hypothetical protein
LTGFDYAAAVADANAAIADAGQLGAIRRTGAPTGPSYNPTPGAAVDHPARFVLLRYRTQEIDGTRVKASDRKALVAPGTLTIEPTLSDSLVEADGTVWPIVGVEPLRPAGTTVLWTLQLRR